MGLSGGSERLAYALPSQTTALGEHITKGSTGIGNTFAQNLTEAMSVVPLRKNGYFGDKSTHKGARYVRTFESSNPSRTAYEFAAKASKNFASMTTIPGKGYIMKMRDGTLITYRYVSSSRDRSPAVELKVRDLKRVKSQKIHFVPRSK